MTSAKPAQSSLLSCPNFLFEKSGTAVVSLCGPNPLQRLPMAPQTPSIRSFFQPEVPLIQNSKRRKLDETTEDMNDGFTPSEIASALQLTLHEWKPNGVYKDMEIGSLIPGPDCVALMGRVVNFYDQVMLSKMPQAAKGCLKVLVKDDTGVLAVSSPHRRQYAVRKR